MSIPIEPLVLKVCPGITRSAPLPKLNETSVGRAVVLLILFVLLGFHLVGLELVLKVILCSKINRG